MRVYFFILLIMLCSFNFFAQTVDILVDTEMSNPTNQPVVRPVKQGEVLSNNTSSYEYQMLAIYDITPHEGVVKVGNKWLINIPPKTTLPIQLRCRCLNKGLKIPPVESLVPVRYQFNKGKGMKTQAKTWEIEKQSKGIIVYDAKGVKEANTCMEATKLAIKKLLTNHNINVTFPNIESYLTTKINCSGISEKMNVDLLVKLIDVPVRLLNLEIEMKKSNDVFAATAIADIYIEPKYHESFGMHSLEANANTNKLINR